MNAQETRNKVLVVDDEPVISVQLEEMLDCLGYDVVGRAGTGIEAVNLAERTNPDVILMDIVMPGEMDGIEACDRIQKKYGIPVVFLTAYADDSFVNRASAVHPYGYILKPFQDAQIKAAIKIALNKRSGAKTHAESLALLETERRYKIVADNAVDVIVTLDQALRVTYVSPAVKRLLGYSPDEFLGQPIHAVLPMSAYKRFKKAYAQLLAEDRAGRDKDPARHWEEEYPKKDGSRIWTECLFKPLRDEQGTVSGLIGCLRDITERKRAEAALRESQKYLSDILASMQEGLCIMNGKGTVLDVNPAFCAMTGLSRRELVGAGPPLPFWAPDHVKDIKEAYLNMLQCQFETFELMFRDKKGRDFPVLVSPFCVRDNLGEVLHYIMTVKDISARVKARQAHEACETRYRDIFQNALEGIFQSTKEGRFIEANPSLARMLGYASPTELIDQVRDIGQDLFVYPQDRARLLSLLENTKKSRASK